MTSSKSSAAFSFDLRQFGKYLIVQLNDLPCARTFELSRFILNHLFAKLITLIKSLKTSKKLRKNHVRQHARSQAGRRH